MTKVKRYAVVVKLEESGDTSCKKVRRKLLNYLLIFEEVIFMKIITTESKKDYIISMLSKIIETLEELKKVYEEDMID